ncbi:transcription factor AP-4 isoform X2 [Rhineura floridana]|uniref:transcription factor AP-4 isoform X2 n=1 Tax=Rhineura floridana TaxID=261503 RepID=UPI002AC7EDD7|nr:transcription factor AP-4 isoform X2 [Rhineura floridana]
MEYFMVPAQKVPSLQHFRKSEKEVIGGLCSLANIPLTPETQRDQERRIRREIANSNERRRMQSINAGFQSLKTLIPHTDGEKLSKAAILQQTAEYIFSLEQEKTRLLQQNAQLKRFIQEFSGSSPKRRRAEDKDEGIGSPDIWEDEKAEDLRREMIELRQQLDKERSVRLMLEEQVRSLEAHMYPEKLKVIAQQVQLQQQQEQLLPAHGPPAPTHHPTVIVPAPPPPPSHHVTVVTMGPSSVINTISTSRQNLDTIVQMSLSLGCCCWRRQASNLGWGGSIFSNGRRFQHLAWHGGRLTPPPVLVLWRLSRFKGAYLPCLCLLQEFTSQSKIKRVARQVTRTSKKHKLHSHNMQEN